MRESDIQRQIMIATSAEVDWFRNNVGCYDANPLCPHCRQRRAPDQPPRWVHYGVGGEGGADLIGVLRGSGIILSAEIKTATGRAREAQLVFARRIAADGGISVVARTISDIRNAIDNHHAAGLTAQRSAPRDVGRSAK